MEYPRREKGGNTLRNIIIIGVVAAVIKWGLPFDLSSPGTSTPPEGPVPTISAGRPTAELPQGEKNPDILSTAVAPLDLTPTIIVRLEEGLDQHKYQFAVGGGEKYTAVIKLKDNPRLRQSFCQVLDVPAPFTQSLCNTVGEIVSHSETTIEAPGRLTPCITLSDGSDGEKTKISTEPDPENEGQEMLVLEVPEPEDCTPEDPINLDIPGTRVNFDGGALQKLQQILRLDPEPKFRFSKVLLIEAGAEKAICDAAVEAQLYERASTLGQQQIQDFVNGIFQGVIQDNSDKQTTHPSRIVVRVSKGEKKNRCDTGVYITLPPQQP